MLLTVYAPLTDLTNYTFAFLIFLLYTNFMNNRQPPKQRESPALNPGSSSHNPWDRARAYYTDERPGRVFDTLGRDRLAATATVLSFTALSALAIATKGAGSTPQEDLDRSIVEAKEDIYDGDPSMQHPPTSVTVTAEDSVAGLTAQTGPGQADSEHHTGAPSFNN